MKNHMMVNGKLLQTNKKFSQLKNNQKLCPPSKNGHRKATKNGMNRSHSFIFLKTAAFIPRFT